MSAQGAVLTNLDLLVFNKGYLYGTGGSGNADAIAWGALQEVTLNHEFSFAEISGPEALPPLGVGVVTETLTGSFRHGVISPEQFITANGGLAVYNAPDTVYTKLTSQEPVPFDLHFESGPSGLDDLDLVLYRCLMNSWSLTMTDKAFVIGAGNFRVYGQATNAGAVLFKYTVPGNQTTAS